MFIFTKEIAKKLALFRIKNGLSQKEVAERMGMKLKSGQSYIAQLEKRKIKNPFLSTILNYLDAVGGSWETFFRELSVLRSKQEHQQIISRAKLPAYAKLQKKLERDALLFETKIKPPQNFYTKVDINRVKQKVEDKVKKYCQQLQIKDNLIPHYIKFAKTIITARKFRPVITQYLISGVSEVYLLKIMRIANKVYHSEQKKTDRQKPIRLEKARSMAEKYLQSRVKLVQVESEVSKVLAQYIAPDNVWHNAYMNFARESYGKIRKFHKKNPMLLKQHLNEIIKAWIRNGLQEEILKEIQDKILAYFS